MCALSPSFAQMPASEEAALPVEAVAISLTPSSSAFRQTSIEARSLKDSVGLNVSLKTDKDWLIG